MNPSGSREWPSRSHSGLRKQEEPYYQTSQPYSNKYDGDPGNGDNSKHPRRKHGDLTVEDISGFEKGYDGDIEVVNPYLYEDADSDSNTPSNVPAKPNTDLDDLWKRGIVDSMKSLDCNSEKDDPVRLPQKRGVKRKPKDMAERLKHSEDLPSRGSPFEVVEIDGGGFSPKKPRRSKRLEAQDGLARSATATAPSDESSSAQPLSTEESRSSTPPDDAMDIDRSTS